ncbi:hypothetical protein J2S49_001250 [Arcanobacterium wilhelmae]|uniref:SAF domain-containing protein n=1 Tax=Arcanobacterium wilhelmae TaxID=1803177 RepID=A0ABT9NBS8_9ACTO|nr:SAF domain-containing protein [Arcanobacterium wilhelmae]MDP9801174.1 hypothetical protein [Arcanobacterium wilhelmae]WFN90526.1 SAF domain-containing protein [Arcanobacterium wilhelmae]
MRAALWRWRYVLLAVVLAIGAQSAVTAVSGEGPQTVRVVVAARDITAGQVASSKDLAFAEVPPSFAEKLVTDLKVVEGKHLVAPVPQGAPVLREQVLDSGFTKNAPPGSVIAAVPLVDSGDLLEVGAQVSLYAPASDLEKDPQARLVAQKATIVGKAVKNSGSTFFTKVDNTTVFYLSISKEEARVVLGIGARTPLTAVLAV